MKWIPGWDLFAVLHFISFSSLAVGILVVYSSLGFFCLFSFCGNDSLVGGLIEFVWFLSSSLLSKNLKIKIYRTIILPVVLYGCETWSLTLRDERRLRVF